MFEHSDPSGSKLKTYELEAESFELHEGARISPGQVIGRDIRSREKVKSDYWSHIATAYFNPMNDSYLVMIYLAGRDEENGNLNRN